MKTQMTTPKIHITKTTKNNNKDTKAQITNAPKNKK